MSPTQYSLDMNLHRRQLNASQLSLIGTKSMESFEREARENQVQGGKTKTKLVAPGPQANRVPLSRDKVAETVGVSGRSIARAKRIITEGSPELVKAVEEGKVALRAAEDIIKLPKEEQPKAIAKTPTNRTPSVAYLSSRTRSRE